MRVEQIYTKCLAQGAYYVESNGEAAIIDPLRDPRPYIELAENANAKIKYVFETHIHADFVSGHLDLATKTGATIVFGSEAKTKYNCYKAVDGEIFKIPLKLYWEKDLIRKHKILKANLKKINIRLMI